MPCYPFRPVPVCAIPKWRLAASQPQALESRDHPTTSQPRVKPREYFDAFFEPFRALIVGLLHHVRMLCGVIC